MKRLLAFIAVCLVTNIFLNSTARTYPLPPHYTNFVFHIHPDDDPNTLQALVYDGKVSIGVFGVKINKRPIRVTSNKFNGGGSFTIQTQVVEGRINFHGSVNNGIIYWAVSHTQSFGKTPGYLYAYVTDIYLPRGAVYRVCP